MSDPTVAQPRTEAGRRLFTDNEPMDMFESDGVTWADVLAIEAEASELAAAWKAAEAALPADWELSIKTVAYNGATIAMAQYGYGLRYYRNNVGPARSVPSETAFATTPADALRALAVRLREVSHASPE